MLSIEGFRLSRMESKDAMDAGNPTDQWGLALNPRSAQRLAAMMSSLLILRRRRTKEYQARQSYVPTCCSLASLATAALCLCCPKVRQRLSFTIPLRCLTCLSTYLGTYQNSRSVPRSRAPSPSRDRSPDFDLGIITNPNSCACARGHFHGSLMTSVDFHRRTASAPSADAQCRSMTNGRDFLTTV